MSLLDGLHRNDRAPAGQKHTFQCAGSNDQEPLIYAGKIGEQFADWSEPGASVIVERDGQKIGPVTTVSDMLKPSI